MFEARGGPLANRHPPIILLQVADIFMVLKRFIWGLCYCLSFAGLVLNCTLIYQLYIF